jgi:hypothetical protein
MQVHNSVEDFGDFFNKLNTVVLVPLHILSSRSTWYILSTGLFTCTTLIKDRDVLEMVWRNGVPKPSCKSFRSAMAGVNHAVAAFKRDSTELLWGDILGVINNNLGCYTFISTLAAMC